MIDFTKDPDAVLDYSIDWSAWLGADRIASSCWDATGPGLEVVAGSFTACQTTVWLRGGSPGRTHKVRNLITTSGGRAERRTITLYITEH